MPSKGSKIVESAGRACEFESLEGRTLLSAEFGHPSMLRWDGFEFEVKTGSFIVNFSESLGAEAAEREARALMDSLGIEAISVRGIGGGSAVVFDTLESIDQSRVQSASEFSRLVTGIQPDRVYHTERVPNDPFLGSQWTLANTGQFVNALPWFSGNGTPGADVNAVPAWDVTVGSRDVIVAVIDTGVDWTHRDLATNIFRNPNEIAGNQIDDDGNGFIDDVRGWDFGEADADPMDTQGHGTACAGIIGAVGNDGFGMTGIAWTVSILPIKIADRFGGLSESAIVAAHDYLTMMIGRGHNIVASNNSYGAFAPQFYEEIPEGFGAERDAIQRFLDAGGTFVASAGNNGADTDAEDANDLTHFPSAYDLPGIISVAATTPTDGLAAFSNYGAQSVDIGAPGVGTIAPQPGGTYTGSFGGTSGAGPHVAGAVALLKTFKPQASAEEIRQALIDAARPAPALQGRMVSGGTLDIARALEILTIDGPLVRRIDPGPVAPSPANQIVVTFNEALDEDELSAGGIALLRSGGDGTFGNGNDVTITISTVSLSSDGKTVTISPASALTTDTFRLTLAPEAFRDPSGNYLNGNLAGGDPEVYTFQLVGASGQFESNDTFLTATPVVFAGDGSAIFTSARVGDGIYGALDIDLYKITMPRGGLITVRVDARSLPNPSTLDGYLRLFRGDGTELASNDQFNAADPYLDFFVTTGGDYYVGVSGFGNPGYDPELAGSGSDQSLGVYNLTIGTELVDPDVVSYEDEIPGSIDIVDQGVITDRILITDTRQILDANVAIDIDHEFLSDLRVSLISPTGTRVELSQRRGGSGDDFTGTTFNDEAITPIASGAAPFTGEFRPDQALSDFDGESAIGLWTLQIEDLAQGNAGRLLGWSMTLTLRNNIFGPFELNDTLTRSRALGIDGEGSTTLTAFLGDGGFGDLDVDLYSFIADAGATLSITVDSTTLNSAIRLFDASGNQIKASAPSGSDSQILGFIVGEGGRFYVGVSEDANQNYDPTLVSSGSAAITTGSYSLSVQVSPGVSDASVRLDGDAVDVGLGNSGAFGTGGLGLSFGGVEFLRTISGITSFFSAQANGSAFVNSSTAVEQSFSLSDQSDAFNRRALTSGVFNGLGVQRAMSYAVSDAFVAFDVVLTNIGSTTLREVSWMEGFNPEQGRELDVNTSRTLNNVDNTDPIAFAAVRNNDFEGGLTIALAAAAADTRAVASFVDAGGVIRDPQLILDNPLDPDPADGNGISGDQTMIMAFDVGTLDPGESATLRYFILLGGSQAAVQAQYDVINAGTGGGHMTATPSDPADDADGIVTLPYRLYHPEGFANDRSSTFIPLLNPNAQASRVVVIARYENPGTGPRDEILFDGVVNPYTREPTGVTVTTPALFAQDLQLVRKNEPYAIEIRSQLPIAATLSHFDFGVSTGESFTSQTSTTWSFGGVSKGATSSDFIVFYNATDADVKVTTTLYADDGSAPIELTQTLGAYRRGGWNLGNEPGVPDGNYAVVVEGLAPIVAAISSYDSAKGGGYGALGTIGIGSTAGAMPEGQFGLASQDETLAILNANDADANITLAFVFENGSTSRFNVVADAQSRTTVVVGDLPGFEGGEPYSVSFESDLAVSITAPTFAFNEAEGSSFATNAHTWWGFADGFRPGGNTNQVTEYLRLYNPSTQSAVVEITISFTNGRHETYRRVMQARAANEYNIHDFVPFDLTANDAFYGLSVRSSTPFVAYTGRFDDFFGGSFGTLGTALGIVSSLG